MKKLLMIAVCALVLGSCTQEKTGFVDTEKLVKDYKEMTDVEAKFTTMNDQLMGELETKAQSFQTKLNEYQQSGQKLSNAERQETENQLLAERQQLQQEQQARSQQLQRESQGAIDSVIKKVKKHIRDYGKSNGYTYIYGKNDAGSVLYGADENDLTDEVLKELNNKYEDNDN